MSDSEHQSAERQRSPRPVSTMALDFNNFLDGAFNLGGEIPTLMESVQDKQDQVSKHNRELEELEARLKAMEERLTKSGAKGSSSSMTTSVKGEQPEASPRPKSSRNAGPPPPTRAPPPPVPSDSERPPTRAPPSRPGTAGRPPTSGRSAKYDYETQPMPEARDQSEYGIAH
ncbi:hypothetical protein FH972_023384 [Carpinus fangiana]|uniref:Uncharacterized protein n=1 Tax=Carpinus fangiana TaxID=176857 RepID=A0A5N6KVD4_9ROSI|nr:hypothetical protein FH972_023384 [Carpinus fangiana]